MTDIPILYEDDALLVVNKPFGIIVNRAQTVKVPTIQDWMDEKFRVQSLKLEADEESFKERSGVVHRLDKETSGCLVLAKKPEVFFKLQSAFKERLVKKEYVALAHGKIEAKVGEINAPVGRLPWNRERFGVVPGGKEAHTRYEVGEYYKNAAGERFTFLSLFPTTGRTHQIRVHLKYLGFPIVGDYLYAGRKQQDKDRLWCPRVFLHAAAISFPHPVSEEQISVTADLPADLGKVISNLEKLEN